MDNHRSRILLVESDARAAANIAKYLLKQPEFSVSVATNPVVAETEIQNGAPSLVLLNDWVINPARQRKLGGLEIARSLLAKSPETPFILYNRHSMSRQRDLTAMESGAYSYILKPWHLPKALAAEAQKALETKHLRDALRDQQILEQTRKLWAHHHKITTTPNLDELYKQVCHAIVELVDADHSGMVLFDANCEQGQLRGEYPGIDSGALDIPVRGIPFEERLVASRKPQIVNDVFRATDLGGVKEIWLQMEIYSIVVVPICIPDRVLGSISLEARRRHREFTRAEIELCEFFANQMAPIIYNALLLDETKRQLVETETLQRQIEEQKNQIARTFRAAKPLARAMAAGELQASLETVAEGLQNALDCDTVLLYRYDSTTQRMDYPPVATDGLYFPEEVARHSRVHEDSIIYETLWLPKMEVVPDTLRDERFAARPFTQREKIRSLVRIPLQAGHHRVGVLFANYREPRAFSDQELDLITYFANLAAVAMDNAGFEQALTALYESNKSLTGDSASHLDEVFARLARRAVEVIEPGEPHDKCAGYIALLRDDHLQFVAADPPDLLARLQSDFPIHRTAKRRGIVGRTIWEAHRYQNIGDVRMDRDYIPLLSGTLSQMTVLIKEGEQIIGAFGMEHTQANAFSPSDVKKLKLLASQASVAIQRARALHLLSQRAQWFKHVLELSRRVASSHNMQDTLAAACRSMVELLGVSHGGLVFFNEDLSHGTVMEEYPARETVGTLIPLRDIPFEMRLINTRSPVVVQNPAQNPGLGPIQEVFERLGTQSLLLVPIQVNGKLIGSFGLDVIGATRVFTDEEIELCEAFASQAGLAIEKARLSEELQETKQTVAELTEENDNRIEFVKLLDHIHLRVPRDVQYALELLLNETLGPLNAKQRDWLETAHEEVAQHRRFLRALKTLALRPSVDDEVITVSVPVRQATALVAPFARRKQINLLAKFDGEPCVRVNPVMLAVTLVFLLDNAVKYTDPDGEVVIHISMSPRWVRLSVDDTGCGVPISDEPMLGTEGFRGADRINGRKGEADGLGLGLYFAYGFVRRCGGELVFSRNGSAGFRAMAYLPRAENEVEVGYPGT